MEATRNGQRESPSANQAEGNMARDNTTSTGLEKQTRERIFSSPVVLAFVRTVVARRGISEAEAPADRSRLHQPVMVGGSSLLQ